MSLLEKAIASGVAGGRRQGPPSPRRKKILLGVIVGCIVVLTGIMVFAVVMNQREAAHMKAAGIRADAVVTRKFTWKQKNHLEDGQYQTHDCFDVTIEVPSGGKATSSSCDRGIDQIYDKTNIGDRIEVMYLAKDLSKDPDGGMEVSDFMLAAWADGKLGSL